LSLLFCYLCSAIEFDIGFMKPEIYFGIQSAIAQIIKDTQWENHVFLVGGCIRDQIMQRRIHDIDIAIDVVNGGIAFARWLQRRKLTARGRSVLVFEHFGTAKVRLKSYPEYVIDFVQTRKDKYIYEEEPCPEKNFGTILEDAIRRDLTINSLYINVSNGEMLDPTGLGLSDIENHIIRTPNTPDITLTDNPMHVLRCIRFAVRYGWELTSEMMEDLKRNVGILAESTKKRMLKEVTAILELKDKDKALQLISEIGAMQYVEPAIAEAEEMIRLGISLEVPQFRPRRNNKKRERNPKRNEPKGEDTKNGEPKKKKRRKNHKRNRPKKTDGDIEVQ